MADVVRRAVWPAVGVVVRPWQMGFSPSGQGTPLYRCVLEDCVLRANNGVDMAPWAWVAGRLSPLSPRDLPLAQVVIPQAPRTGWRLVGNDAVEVQRAQVVVFEEDGTVWVGGKLEAWPIGTVRHPEE